jgi:hypothetical protein
MEFLRLREEGAGGPAAEQPHWTSIVCSPGPGDRDRPRERAKLRRAARPRAGVGAGGEVGGEAGGWRSAELVATMREVRGAEEEYARECGGGSPRSGVARDPVPATNRPLPHINIEAGAHPRAAAVLALLRRHPFLRASPGHSKSFALSHRGHVEASREGLSEFQPLAHLGLRLDQASPAPPSRPPALPPSRPPAYCASRNTRTRSRSRGRSGSGALP